MIRFAQLPALIKRLRSFLKRLPLGVKIGGLVAILLLLSIGWIWQLAKPASLAQTAPIQATPISHKEPDVAATPGQDATATPAQTPQPKPAAAASTPAPAPKSVKSATQTPTKPASTPTGSWTTPPVSTEFRVSYVTLQEVSSQCSAGQWFYAVRSAWVGFTSSRHVAGTVRWYWETRVDSGTNSYGPPIDGYVYTQNAPSGQGSISLEGSGPAPSNILTTDSKSTYGYSFRLHITAPNDITTSWVSVPQGGC